MKLEAWKHSLKTLWSVFFSTDKIYSPITEEYPDPVSSRSEDELPARTRGRIKNKIEQCTGCDACVVLCPTKAIEIKKESFQNISKVWVEKFVVDYGSCLHCGLCVEVCQPRSLSHEKNFIRPTKTIEELKVDFGRGPLTSTEREKWILNSQIEEVF